MVAQQTDSPPLTEDEIADIEYFYSHPEEHKTYTLEELLEELRND